MSTAINNIEMDKALSCDRLVTLKHKYLNGHQQEENHPVLTPR
jgi:hypothetical protein